MSSKQMNQTKKKKQYKSLQYQTSKSHIYACFQQPQTIQIVKYLSMPAPNKLFFDSNTKNVGKNASEIDKIPEKQKKSKEFKFHRIYQRQEKFKYAFSEQINFIISQLFQGYSQTVFIYGTQESKKDKILIGQSQNPGFLLTTLAQIFQYCHDKQIQDEVTIKISSSMFKDGKFTDPFNCSQNHSNSTNQNQNPKDDNNTANQQRNQFQQFQNIMCDDMFEGKYLLGSPQIIIRNMRTALKIINLISKKIQQRRDSKEQNTQNLLFTIKIQIDTAFDRYTTGQVYEYSIPKLHIIKLGNPSIDNTLNGVNKNNQWFINLFNYLQNEVVLQKSNKRANINISNNQLLQNPLKQLNQILLGNGTQNTSNKSLLSQQKDIFTQYIKTVAMNGIADIHCFTSINNKMTSNQCLTAFIFNNYLSAYQTKPAKRILNINIAKNQKNNYEQQLMNVFVVRETQNNRERQISEKYRLKYNLEPIIGNTTNRINPRLSQASTSLIQFPKFNSQQKSNASKSKQSNYNKNDKQSKKNAQNSNQIAQYIDPGIIKQTLQRILSFSPSDQKQIQYTDLQNKLFLLTYIESIKKFMSTCNLVEYQYAQILSQACQKLSKYIFNQQIQQFYYAKKISLQHSLDLVLALQSLKTQKLKVYEIEQKIMKKINANIKKVNYQLEALKSINGRQEHQQLFKVKKQKAINLVKQKDLFTKIFQYYNTMSFHYIYQDNPRLLQQLQKTKKLIQDQFQRKNNLNNNIDYEQIMKNIKKGFNKRIQERRKTNAPILEQTNNQVSDQKDEQNQNTKENIIPDQGSKERQNYKGQVKTASCFLNTSYNQSIIGQNKLNDSILKSSNAQISPQKQKQIKYKMRKKADQLDNMFTNSNVGVVRPQFQRKNYNK